MMQGVADAMARSVLFVLLAFFAVGAGLGFWVGWHRGNLAGQKSTAEAIDAMYTRAFNDGREDGQKQERAEQRARDLAVVERAWKRGGWGWKLADAMMDQRFRDPNWGLAVDTDDPVDQPAPPPPPPPVERMGPPRPPMVEKIGPPKLRPMRFEADEVIWH